MTATKDKPLALLIKWLRRAAHPKGRLRREKELGDSLFIDS